MNGPAWRKPKLKKVAGLLETHRRLATLLRSARNAGSMTTLKTYLGCLRDNARVLRGKILGRA
jgi:hypothetical protein